MRRRDIQEHMTAFAQTIDASASLRDADELMSELQIRHLPVVDRGELVGLLSQSDLHLVETVCRVDPKDISVQQAMTPDPYTVPVDEPLAEVARVMAERRLGCVIITSRGQAAGIFTATDAIRVLAEYVSRVDADERREIRCISHR